MAKTLKNIGKSIHKNHFKSHHKVFLCFLMVNLMAISLVSAFDFDNVKDYDPDTKTITITNAFGLGDELARITLNTPLEMIVWPGEEVLVAQFTIENYEGYNNVFGELEFYTKSNKVNKGYNYKYKTPEDWRSLNSAVPLPKGKIVIGIFTDVEEGEEKEWIPNLFGVRITEWAVFIGATKFEYYEVGDVANAVSRDSLWNAQTFMIGETGTNIDFELVGINLKLASANSPNVLNFNVMITEVNSSNAPDFTNILSVNNSINVTNISGAGWYNISMPTLTLNSSNRYAIILNGTGIAPNGMNWYYNSSGKYTGGSRWSGTNGLVWLNSSDQDFMFQVWGTSEDITTTLLNPVNNTETINISLNFSATQSASKYNLTNVTYKIWRDSGELFNETFVVISGNSNSTTKQIDDFTLDKYLWNVLTCGENDTTTSCEYAENNYSLTTGIETSDLTYNSETTEGNSETFKINISTISGEVLTEVNLIYNNTEYQGTFISLGGNNYSASEVITVPSISAEVNKTFYFNIVFSSGFEYNTTSNNQTVKALTLDDCSVNNIMVLNFTLVDEKNQTKLNGSAFNTKIEIDIEMFTKGTTTNPIIELSQNYTQVNPATVCISDNLSSSEYRVDATIRYVSNSREVEYYYLQNFILSNSTTGQNITLYDLLSVDSEQFSVTYRDENFLAVSDALIDVQRQYVDEGIFKTVEIGKTDADGRTILHLVRNDVVYTMIVKKDGVILSTFNNIIAFCDDFTIGDCKISLNEQETGVPVTDWNSYQNLDYTISFDEDTRTITTVFTTLDGSAHTVTLNATKADMWGNDAVCSDKLTTSSGTLTCVIPDSYGNVTVRVLLYSYSTRNIITTRIYKIFPNREDIFGGDGLIFLFIMVITIPLMFITSTIGIVIGAIIGLIASGALMIYTGFSWLGTGSTIMWLIIAGMIIIWKISERSKS